MIETDPWVLDDGGALDIDQCPDCWERRVHIERYEFACLTMREERVLDFGCGVGYGSEMLARAGNSVTAVDTSEQAIQLARSRRGDIPNLSFEQDAHASLANDYYAVIAFEVIEHLGDPEAFLDSIRAKQLIASVPVVPTVWRNRHHRRDYTVESFRWLLKRRCRIVNWWIQVQPFHNSPSVVIMQGELIG